MINLKNIFELIKKYIALKFELFKYSFHKGVSTLLASIITWALFLVPTILFIFFCSFLVGWYIGQILQNTSIGFLIVTSFYFLFAVIVYIGRNKIKYYFYENILKSTQHIFTSPEEPISLTSIDEESKSSQS